MVYFIQAEELGLIKIGRTNQSNLILRLKAMQVGSPDKLKLIGVVNDEHSFGGERGIHKKFESLWVHGEWYYPGKDLLEFINLLGPLQLVGLISTRRNTRDKERDISRKQFQIQAKNSIKQAG